MPSLGNHDPKSLVKATKDDINAARRLAETVITVDGMKLQFDNISRQRLKDVISGMGEDQVNWRMYDNEVIAFFKDDLQALFDKAESMMGEHTLKIFQRADRLKERLDAGDFVTLADLRLEAWTY
ncbi:Uncharacterised protein [Ectopseudomonas mendocina]|uniref:DUF4376 domain-containing protein n=1 Tax=Ectopseudomonas mendocina TaxID=300 RepID=A0A379PP10_ECTME|nr:DUF4376 domain-containing protein [Pseudomonas mendocina]SUE95809.1 Uncharacterised protein [Pseudomonas mendocina]